MHTSRAPGGRWMRAAGGDSRCGRGLGRMRCVAAMMRPHSLVMMCQSSRLPCQVSSVASQPPSSAHLTRATVHHRSMMRESAPIKDSLPSVSSVVSQPSSAHLVTHSKHHASSVELPERVHQGHYSHQCRSCPCNRRSQSLAGNLLTVAAQHGEEHLSRQSP